MVLNTFCCFESDLISMELFKLKKAYRKAAISFADLPHHRTIPEKLCEKMAN